MVRIMSAKCKNAKGINGSINRHVPVPIRAMLLEPHVVNVRIHLKNAQTAVILAKSIPVPMAAGEVVQAAARPRVMERLAENVRIQV